MIKKIHILITALATLLAACSSNSRQEKDDGCSPGSTKLFEKQFAPFTMDPGKLYGLGNKSALNAYEASESNCNDLMLELNYEFESVTDSTQYYISNVITLFKAHPDAIKGWELGTESFWKSALEKIDSSQIAVFRDSKSYPLGDLSEYSEIPVGSGFVMAVMHIRLNDLFLKYAAIIPVEKKEMFAALVKEKVEGIRKVHFKVN